MTSSEFGWDDVVRFAKGSQLGGSLINTCAPPLASAQPPLISKPQSAQAPRSEQQTNTPPLKEQKAADGRPICPDCSRIGIGNPHHRHEVCFLNKKGRAYKPEVRKRRFEQARAQGISIPADMLDEGDTPPGNMNHVGGEIQDMYAAMSGNTNLQPEQKEVIIDTVINEQQGIAHLVYNFNHESDGSAPPMQVLNFH